MTTEGAPPVTLADVAARAGVHPATVSRAVSKPHLVQAATLARVRLAVEDLGYVPNRAARQLASGRSSTVAVLVPDITNPFFSAIVQAAQHRAAESDLLLLVGDTGQSVQSELDLVRSLTTSVDGLLLCTPVAPTKRLVEAAAGRPLVFLNRSARDVSSVLLDQRAVATQAIAHLQLLGHERIGVLAGPARYWSTAQRSPVFEASGLVRLGSVPPTFEGGTQAISRVIDSSVTGVVAFNDVMALGLVAAAVQHGLKVPEDLSVIGSDDVPMAAMANPALTTINAPVEKLGLAALDALTARLDGGVPTTVVIEPHVVVRASTAEPARSSQ